MQALYLSQKEEALLVQMDETFVQQVRRSACSCFLEDDKGEGAGRLRSGFRKEFVNNYGPLEKRDESGIFIQEGWYSMMNHAIVVSTPDSKSSSRTPHCMIRKCCRLMM